MTLHRIDSPEVHSYLFRFRLFNGTEFHFVAPTLELALVLFQKHPAYDGRVISATQVAKIDG